MAATLTDSAIALARLQAMLAWDQEPALSAQEVSDLLDEYEMGIVYPSEATQFLPGERAVPTVLNGRWYRSEANDLAGTAYTTSGTEPDWPRYLHPWNGGDGGRPSVTDGTVVWVDDGPAPMALWDLKAAAHEGWLRKAALVAGWHEIADSNMRAKRKEVHDNCLSMARRYVSLRAV